MATVVGDNIRLYRKSMSMTQQKLAKELGVTRQTVSNWEKGVTDPDISSLQRLSDIFKITVDELIKPWQPRILWQEGGEVLRIPRKETRICILLNAAWIVCFALYFASPWYNRKDIFFYLFLILGGVFSKMRSDYLQCRYCGEKYAPLKWFGRANKRCKHCNSPFVFDDEDICGTEL